MMAIFGEYPGVPPEAKGVTAVGGTILEVAAIDDPAIAQFLGEVKGKKMGPETMNLATKILNSMLPGLGAQAAQQQNPQTNPQAPMVPGASVNLTQEQQQAQEALNSINIAMKTVDERRSANTGSGAKTLVPGVGTYVEGSTMFGTIPVNKYFNLNGEEISKSVFDERLKMVKQQHQDILAKAPSQTQPSVTPSQPAITPATTPQTLPPPSTQAQQPSVVTLPNGQQSIQPNTSSSMAGQKQVPSIGSRDLNNTEFLVIKSIYNIVG